MRYIYLHGFASSPQSTKARYFAARFAELGMGLDIPDLAPDFENMTITSQLEIVGRAAEGASSTTLIGSSMGGYVAALCAARNASVKKLVLMAPAFGLSRRWAESLGGDRVEDWRRTGKLRLFHYGERRERDLNYAFVADAAEYPDFPNVSVPALLLHGRNDDVVPMRNSEVFAADRPERRLRVFESGHELTDVLGGLWEESKLFLEPPGGYGKS